MPKIFEIKTGKFIERKENKPRSLYFEIPEPATILHGEKPPSMDLGNPGDFYIDTINWTIYGPKTELWGEPMNIIGPAGESIKGEQGIPGIQGKQGEQGKQGKQGEQGEHGVDGLLGIQGLPGRDGENGKDGVNGETAPKIELRRAQTHIQWRYVGGAWHDLFAIPKARSGGGGAHSLKELTDFHDFFIERYSTISVSGSILAAATNTVYDNDGASALVVVGLPAAARGLKYTFLVTDANGFRLDAAGADTIRVSGSISTAGGTQTCKQIGGAITIYGLSGRWVASASQRTWIEA